MLKERGLDYERIDIMCAANDEIFRTPTVPDIAVGIDRAEIAGIQPPLSRRRRIEEKLRIARGIEITRSDARPADRQNTHGPRLRVFGRSRPERYATGSMVWKRDADGTKPRFNRAGIEYEGSLQLRHAPTLAQRDAELLAEFACDLDRNRGTSSPESKTGRRLLAVSTCDKRRCRGWCGTRNRHAVRFDKVPEARDDARVTIPVGTNDDHRLSVHHRGEREAYCASHMKVRHPDRNHVSGPIAV